MSKKKFVVINNRGNLSNVKQEFEKIMEEKTLEKISSLEIEPTKDKVEETIQIVNEDTILPEEAKNKIIKELKSNFINLFNFENCPEDYEELKYEAKLLSDINQYSLIMMAQRLLKIRNQKLYTNDGYRDFQEFIENELLVSRRTAYNYIELVECFGDKLIKLENKIEYSKLLPIISILKSESLNDFDKSEIKDKFLDEMNKKSKNQIIEEANQLKRKYGLIKDKNKVLFDIDNRFLDIIKYIENNEMSLKDKILINGYIEKISNILNNKKEV
ncbi:MAG: hypothetical protein A2086_01750 [Spirochaetes bacterium GWD1_27_9]|nr:MAG: hypothetical protein A2Z98_03980 [Spirochaetes bacterium GWB1_27_13]OHD20606.1 MAG: hypothetical protein A2Y34_17460 [Spirochaetes bacterium GWC1_27_15]OHD41827.1 MAG: hypothetical protein A2086_01750 [Spirochaetes bacterium GWD1_27_9]